MSSFERKTISYEIVFLTFEIFFTSYAIVLIWFKIFFISSVFFGDSLFAGVFSRARSLNRSDVGEATVADE